MWYKPYGRTGKQVSAVSFGGMRFANPDDIDASAATVLHAYRRGVNYFDTAPGYCKNKSEDIVGAAVKQMKPGTFYVSTKCNSAKADELRQTLEKSLQRLNVQKIDFFHIWWVVTMEAWRQRVAGGAIQAALKAKEEGLIEHLVISSHMLGGELRQVLNEAPFEGVTLGYNAINFRFREDAVDAAGEKNIGVVTMNPLGGGLIPRCAERFSWIKAADDASVISAAIRFNISHPHITSALVGCADIAQVDEAVNAVANHNPYPREHVEKIRKMLPEAFDGLCTGCGYCLPCPEGVPIPRMMDTYNMKLLGGVNLQDHLKWHWGAAASDAANCSLCGACETRCTQHLPIRERLKEIAAIPTEKK
jgi:predicted aldo/keto reductase-like oxidoreductase